MKCEEQLAEGLNVCLLEDHASSIACEAGDPRCEGLTYCSFNLLDQQAEQILQAFPAERQDNSYLNMLRYTCPKAQGSRCPANSQGQVLTLEQIGDTIQVSEKWNMLKYPDPVYCGHKVRVSLSDPSIDLSQFKLSIKVKYVQNAEVVVQTMPADQFRHLPGTSINSYVHMHPRSEKVAPAEGWDFLIYF